MKIIVKKLQGGECNIEVSPTTLISQIKRDIAAKWDIPPGEQKLLLLGRTLVDDQTVQCYPSIKEGTKVNLVVRKTEGLFEVSVKYFKKLGMSEVEAVARAKRLIKIVHDKFYKLSWDDVDRLLFDCLLDESGQKRQAIATETECEDSFAL